MVAIGSDEKQLILNHACAIFIHFQGHSDKSM